VKGWTGQMDRPSPYRQLPTNGRKVKIE